MAKPNKTQITEVSVDEFIAGVTPDARREDAVSLRAELERLSGQPARMWGPTIVGVGVRRYRTPAGREGQIPAAAFSPRKPALVLYLTWKAEGDPLVQRLGTFTTGKSCIYVKRLADIDRDVLAQMIVRALERIDEPMPA